jgi:hypothetical protein
MFSFLWCCVPLGPDIANTPFFKFQIWDMPGKYDFSDGSSSAEDADLLFRKSHAIVFVIDGQVGSLDFVGPCSIGPHLF